MLIVSAYGVLDGIYASKQKVMSCTRMGSLYLFRHHILMSRIV